MCVIVYLDWTTVVQKLITEENGMNQGLKISTRNVFGLAVDIVKTSQTKSGFEPAPFDLGAGEALFGSLRLDGFAALLRIGFAEHLTLAGGDEGRYKNETPHINRAWAIREILIHDYGIDPERVSYAPSNSNTGGNIIAIRGKIEEMQLDPNHCRVVTSHYHVSRAYMDLQEAKLNIPVYSAEAFWLLEQAGRKNLLIERFGGDDLAKRVAVEINGIADKIRGTFKSRTDASAVFLKDALNIKAL